MTQPPDIVVFRRGTEALSPAAYAEAIRRRLPEWSVALARTPQEERDLLSSARIATGISITEEQVSLAEQLDLFVVASSGTDHLPMDRLREQNVLVANASGIHAPGIAEQVLGYLLVFARRIHRGIRQQSAHQWRHYQATELMGSTVTVVGLGSIGPTDEVIGFEPDKIHEAFARSDYVVLCSPLTETTHGLVGSEEFGTLGPDAVVVNVGRGPLIETSELVDALRKGEIGGCALDVTDPEPLPSDHPLWDLDNVIITPHMGGHTPEHWPRLADILAENAKLLDDETEQEGFRNVITN